MRSMHWLWILISVVAACGSGSEHPTMSQAAAEIAPSFCARMKTCFGGSFDESACVRAFEGAVPSSQRDDLDACTNDQIDQCVRDMPGMTCPAASTTDLTRYLPSSCLSC